MEIAGETNTAHGNGSTVVHFIATLWYMAYRRGNNHQYNKFFGAAQELYVCLLSISSEEYVHSLQQEQQQENKNTHYCYVLFMASILVLLRENPLQEANESFRIQIRING